MRLDKSVRARLRVLAGRGSATALEAPARSGELGAGLAPAPDRRRRRDMVIQGLSLSCAAGLAVAVSATLESRAPVPPRATGMRKRPAAVAPALPPATPATQAGALSAAPLAACAGAASLAFSLDAQRRLDLGTRALMVANHGAVVGAAQSPECDLRAGLADGTLAVHARDLEGRALVVATSRAELRVKGTVFLVDFYAASGELEVGVEEGQVELVTREGRSVTLGPGQAAYLGRHLELEPFDDNGRARLRRMLGLAGKRERSQERRAHADSSEQRPSAGGEAQGQVAELGASTSEQERREAKRKKRSPAQSREPQPKQDQSEADLAQGNPN